MIPTPDDASDEDKDDAQGTSQDPARVLVLDDDRDVRSSVVRLLQRHGLEAHAAENGADALVLLRELTFTLMYCDVNLNGESGVDLLPAFLALAPELPIVMFSGVNEAEIAASALRAGAVDYVTKPVPLARFIAITEDHIGTRESAMVPGHSLDGAKRLHAGAPLLGQHAGALALAMVERQRQSEEQTGRLVSIVGTLADVIAEEQSRSRHEQPRQQSLPKLMTWQLVDPPPANATTPMLLVPRSPRWRRRLRKLLRVFGRPRRRL